ncbi:preprotein translocase subunit SecG [Sphingomonas sp.]|uniref:preprotein translocase subunit SecG n=1 Tax=Sphingomonas sp. TaxID=28214 RepID=UPI001D904CEF|nr:preprotein translocase subunit SecG [Sphingomonas sp.]MBX9795637.1 preprotein translocase subunit SecG [Sphingomonas sp.]
MIFTFLLVVQALVAAAMVGVILMQRSEGGGLGMGGSPTGLMSARGAADFLTRTTSILAVLFIGLSILLAVLAATRNASRVQVPTAAQRSAPAAPRGGAGALGGAPAANFGTQKSAAQLAAEAANGAAAAKAPPPPANGSVPLER